ncbi:hypothetical protein [Sphingomonas montanisoli]|uniref:Uncharacterized protein n=1 Tax=Sphingomonas montanisoli TaxID=2606412 RepID=A0A5D9C2X4_9SPHN|nr:hypothetical protein [Sphingomonas montanisoli]TZG25803.1 hypothetical protein FYJ91_12485 [Sphingomonas montanisoli]
MTTEEMDALTGGTDNKSEKIRILFKAGVSTGDIGRYLKIRYQHTYNVLLRAGLIVKPGERQAVADETIVLQLGKSGEVKLPEAMLASHGLAPGDQLVCRTGPDGLTIMSRAKAIEYLREIARSRMPGEVSLLEALLDGPKRRSGTTDSSG